MCLKPIAENWMLIQHPEKLRLGHGWPALRFILTVREASMRALRQCASPKERLGS